MSQIDSLGSMAEQAPQAPLAPQDPLVWLSQDDFTVLGLPRQFALDSAALESRYQQLQRLVHPDRFVAQGAAAARVAMQLSARLNEAVRRLRDPFARAQYLCALRGAPVQDTNAQGAMPQDFLIEQMQWHEAIDAAEDQASLATLTSQIAARIDALLAAAVEALDRDAATASSHLRQSFFFRRLQQSAQHKWQTLQPTQTSLAAS